LKVQRGVSLTSERNMQGKPVLLFGRGCEFARPFPLT
jgi:hypothetical protein